MEQGYIFIILFSTQFNRMAFICLALLRHCFNQLLNSLKFFFFPFSEFSFRYSNASVMNIIGKKHSITHANFIISSLCNLFFILDIKLQQKY